MHQLLRDFSKISMAVMSGPSILQWALQIYPWCRLVQWSWQLHLKWDHWSSLTYQLPSWCEICLETMWSSKYLWLFHTASLYPCGQCQGSDLEKHLHHLWQPLQWWLFWLLGCSDFCWQCTRDHVCSAQYLVCALSFMVWSVSASTTVMANLPHHGDANQNRFSSPQKPRVSAGCTSMWQKLGSPGAR